ncbi:MAG: class I SAM-dependent methyltransferase [Methanoregula sp.]|jgi:2-polyprenyl-3-methyl-5-hydroxy-6-metoxy-1,4-benzoquinol methylase|nr:class I SAM-dependent methyltransferase [Methanoregula sp.]
MTDLTVDTQGGTREGSGGLAFLLVVMRTILKSLWSAIKGINDPQTKKTEMFWDMVSNDFDNQARAEENRGEQTHLKTVKNTKKYLKVSDHVLDYGCATGTVALEIVNNVKEVHGIDISSKMIEAANKKAAEHNTGKLDFVQTTIFDDRLKRESFDVILAFNILHFSEDTEKVMQRIHELLKPGGLFFSATPCLGENKSCLSVLLSLVTKTGIIPPMRFYKISELKDSVSRRNFQIVETECLVPNPTEYYIVARKM